MVRNRGLFPSICSWRSIAAKENSGDGAAGAIDSLSSETVVQTVADAEDTTPIELSPLYETIDPDALDALFQGQTFRSTTFNYEGYTVTVREDGEIDIRR